MPLPQIKTGVIYIYIDFFNTIFSKKTKIYLKTLTYENILKLKIILFHLSMKTFYFY